ncbi:rCG28461, partial [Rattus norvegicus]
MPLYMCTYVFCYDWKKFFSFV